MKSWLKRGLQTDPNEVYSLPGLVITPNLLGTWQHQTQGSPGPGEHWIHASQLINDSWRFNSFWLSAFGLSPIPRISEGQWCYFEVITQNWSENLWHSPLTKLYYQKIPGSAFACLVTLYPSEAKGSGTIQVGLWDMNIVVVMAFLEYNTD